MDDLWYDRIYAGIDLEALRFNMESMHDRIQESTKIMAVVKANAYGHGASRIAEEIEHFPYLWGFAVATVEEAERLVADGRKKPILVLGLSFSEAYMSAVAHEIRLAVCDFSAAKELSELAVRMNKICHIHVKIDTGMSRIGFQVNENSAEIIAQIAALPNIDIEGIFTHFAKADEKDRTSAEHQIALFCKMIFLTEMKGLKIPIHHCSNSAGIIQLPEANMDMVRAGITLYGLWPSDEVSKICMPLRPVMSLKSHISFIKELEEGREIGYGGTYVTNGKRRIATIPVGYADGYSRGLSNKGYVLIHGKKAPVRGRVCMDQFMVDVTEIPEARQGDVVTLLGYDGDQCITMEELGALSGRFNYEFACLVTDRVPRIFFD